MSLGTTISQSSDFDGVSHGSRLKVGPNISLVRISSNTRINANLEHSARARLWRGGAVIEDHIAQSSSPRAAAFASSGPIAVLPGDEFDFYIIPIAAVSTQIGASPSDTPWLLLEVLA